MSIKNSPTADHTLSLGLPAHSLVRPHSRITLDEYQRHVYHEYMTDIVSQHIYTAARERKVRARTSESERHTCRVTEPILFSGIARTSSSILHPTRIDTKTQRQGQRQGERRGERWAPWYRLSLNHPTSKTIHVLRRLA